MNRNTPPQSDIGLALAYRVRRSGRAKNTRIVVRPGLIEVVAPFAASEAGVKAFVDAQREWIAAAVRRIQSKRQAISGVAPARYADGALVPYRGESFPLRTEPTAERTVQVSFHHADGFMVNLPAASVAQNASEIIRQSLIRWMKNEARIQAIGLIDEHASRLGLFPRSVKIKTQKSRWGSCGPNDDINLNWLLILVPPPVLEYVVVHELCHIRHKNHSKAFWALVAEYLPAYQQQRLWLKQNGANVMQGL